MQFLLLCLLLLPLSCSPALAREDPINQPPSPPSLLQIPEQQQPGVGVQPQWLSHPAPRQASGPQTAVPLLAPGQAVQPAPDKAKAQSSATNGGEKRQTEKNRPARSAPPARIKDRSRTVDQETAAPPVAEETEQSLKIESILTKRLESQEGGKASTGETLDMLNSLIELQKNLKVQIAATTRKLKGSTSESEKVALQEELGKLDRQLSETGVDFERIATGVDHDIFNENKQTGFSWKDELASLLEPSIKELKQLTARARQKSDLKESIEEYNRQLATAHRAVEHLNRLIAEADNTKIKNYLGELLPAWENVKKRIGSKLDLAQHELAKLESKNVSLLESSSASMKEFFRDRGLYLLIAFLAFAAIFLAVRLLARLLFVFLPGAKKEQRPTHVRILDIFFQVFSVASAITGLIFVLYLAEDWFLLSVTIIFFAGIAWTVRQALPKMWQQARLVLNMGALREGERVIYGGVPWRVESLNVFCKLSNPALGQQLRIPIEDMIGLVSRPYHHDEPWFPCRKGDWVAIDGMPNAKVVSLSHEQVELVELGSRRIVYQTADFLSKSPANLSRDFTVSVTFGLSYGLQDTITTTVVETLKNFLGQRLEEHDFRDDCLNLTVDFLQAGASSLDLVVFASFKGEAAAMYKRLERALNRWCVDCCNANGWEIPFPQLTVHLPEGRGE